MSFKFSQTETPSASLGSTVSSGLSVVTCIKHLYEYLTWLSGAGPSDNTCSDAFFCLYRIVDMTQHVARDDGSVSNLEWTRTAGWVHHTWVRWRVLLSTDIDGALVEVRRHGTKTTGRGYYLTINGVVIGGHDNLTYDKAKVLFTRAVFMLSGEAS